MVRDVSRLRAIVDHFILGYDVFRVFAGSRGVRDCCI
jgi:hypothetical protein